MSKLVGNKIKKENEKMKTLSFVVISIALLGCITLFIAKNKENENLTDANKKLNLYKDSLLSENKKLEEKISVLNDSMVILENKKNKIIETIREVPVYFNNLSLQSNEDVAKKIDDVFSLSEFSNEDSTYLKTKPIVYQDRPGFIIDRWIGIDYIILDTLLDSYVMLEDANNETIKNLKYQNSYLKQEVSNFNKISKVDSTINSNLNFMLKKEKNKTQLYKSIVYGSLTTISLSLIKTKPKTSIPLGMLVGGISYAFKI